MSVMNTVRVICYETLIENFQHSIHVTSDMHGLQEVIVP